MKLDDCYLQVRSVISAPFEHDEPSQDWREAKVAGQIPGGLWDLYRSTRYLSASALGGFETAEERIITVYFSRLIRSAKACLTDAADLRDQMREWLPRQYDPRKSGPNRFDRRASRRYRSAFRSLLVNLIGALDVLADSIAILLPRQIPKLVAGSASFNTLEKWLRSEQVLPLGLITPAQHYSTELHESLASEVIVRSGPERDWLPLMRMYRNKVAHLGHDSYVQFGFEPRVGNQLAFFIPRSWPFVAEQYATLDSSITTSEVPVDWSAVVKNWLMHQDLEDYSEGALKKIHRVLGIGFGVLNRAYMQQRGIPVSNETLADLESSRQRYDFEYFEES